jgi:hypothetical protein
MAFTLRSQSPLNQKKDPMDRFKTPNPSIQKSLDKSSSKHPESKVAPKNGSNYSDVDPYGVGKAVGQLVDPTGVSSYGDVKKTWNDGKTDYNDIVEPIGALPVIGKIPKLIKSGFRLAKSLSAVEKVAKAANKVNKVTSKVNTASKASNVEKLGETLVTPLNQKKSPLLKQKLSPKAAKAKAVRDLAFAKTDDRRAKKAHAQRMHRKSPSNKGKDYDHEDGRFESVNQNRGNDGNGTKSESGKKYSTK